MARLTRLVVVGDDGLADRCRAMVPEFEVIGPAESPDLADPVGAVGAVRTMLGAGGAPLAVLCPAIPGFTALTQVDGLPPERCLVLAEGGVWPAPSVRSFADALQMTFLPALEALPKALGPGRPRRGWETAAPTRSPSPDAPARPDPGPVHLPPAPLPRPELGAARGSPGETVEAARPPAPPAYRPTDILRPLRPGPG